MKYKILFLLSLVLLSLAAAGFYLTKTKKTTDTDIPSVLTRTVISVKNEIAKQTSPVAQIKHVFVIFEENHSWSAIKGSTDAPYLNNQLLKTGAYASDYHNVPVRMGELHPSELNYIFMESGQVAFSDHTFTTDNDPTAANSTSSMQHLTALLDKKGISWKSYQEDISGTDCPIASKGEYAPKHNPMLFFQDVSGNPPSSTNKYCIEHVRPLTELSKDIASGNLPSYVFITPNLQHDMHNGTIQQADTWLSQIIPTITNSSTFKKDGALFITWDEGSEPKDDKTERNDPIGMIIVSPFVKAGYTNTTEYSHASLLKTIEEIFQLQPLLGEAGNPQTKDLSDFFK